MPNDEMTQTLATMAEAVKLLSETTGVLGESDRKAFEVVERLVTSVNFLTHRVERLEGLLIAYAQVKGDGAVLERLGKRQDEKLADLYSELRGRPDPGPIPDENEA